MKVTVKFSGMFGEEEEQLELASIRPGEGQRERGIGREGTSRRGGGGGGGF